MWPQGGLSTDDSKGHLLCCGSGGGYFPFGHNEGVIGPGQGPHISFGPHQGPQASSPRHVLHYFPPQGLPRDQLQEPVWGSLLLPSQVESRCWLPRAQLEEASLLGLAQVQA